MTIDPVKIPQNVYVEDRIIGSITLRQIIICLLTGGLSYGMFASVKAAGILSAVTGVLAWTPLVVGAAFAFVKINGITLTRFCLLMLEKSDKPAIRVWAPRRGITISIGTASMKSDREVASEKKIEEVNRHKEEKNRRIHELSELLDKGPSDADLVEEPDAVIAEETSAAPTLPVDTTRIRAEPLTENGTLDGIRTLPTASSLIRDIAPPRVS
ncbi:hypothetical protein A3C37_02200 [Candidatus Peribacteria bacterium RIFCSPHIGHO2_02_FULL_53_20]|nr:MAG: hypothetical protein A3C37_02200 [Candidatus Peribacteria bacterium RIFCSPHIGHO2_02_FULL_53_20]OGJ69839.1 MAG: hypothetical protein A3G69_00165 [Candidatus Peribacteria bacterium RIFCSPLOWO2_12_FULL_53_10]